MSGGTYNWSNGDNGQQITVHNGGVYQVTYTAPSGCSASTTITIPHVSDRYMWVFPTGCFDICPFDNPQPYIIGPWATFDHYAWLVNGNVALSGSNTSVQNLPVNQAGTYQLILQNDGCIYESGIAYVSPNPESCQIEPCELKVVLKEDVHIVEGNYHKYGSVFNPNAYPITVSISSFGGYGIYTPSTITIPAGGNYNFNPLVFTPNPGFNGGDDHIVFQIVGQDCMTLYRVRYPSLYGGTSVSSSTGNDLNVPYLTVSPNPASTLVAISYDISRDYKQAEEIRIYDLNGKLLTHIPLENAVGQVAVDVSAWQSSTYIVSLHANGERILQQKLIVKQ